MTLLIRLQPWRAKRNLNKIILPKVNAWLWAYTWRSCWDAAFVGCHHLFYSLVPWFFIMWLRKELRLMKQQGTILDLTQKKNGGHRFDTGSTTTAKAALSFSLSSPKQLEYKPVGMHLPSLRSQKNMPHIYILILAKTSNSQITTSLNTDFA